MRRRRATLAGGSDRGSDASAASAHDAACTCSALVARSRSWASALSGASTSARPALDGLSDSERHASSGARKHTDLPEAGAEKKVWAGRRRGATRRQRTVCSETLLRERETATRLWAWPPERYGEE